MILGSTSGLKMRVNLTAAGCSNIYMSDRSSMLYMGNIRPTYIKKIAKELIEKRGYAFGTDFEANKVQVAEHTDITSKTIRNRVAGYIVRRSVIAKREKIL